MACWPRSSTTAASGSSPRNGCPADAGEVLDVLSALAVAVTFSFMAVESLANEIIERLPDESTWPGRSDEELSAEGMVRWLTIAEKLQEVIPHFTDVKRLPRGERTWQRFMALNDLRDDVEDAFAVCDSIAPGYFPDNVRVALEVD